MADENDVVDDATDGQEEDRYNSEEDSNVSEEEADWTPPTREEYDRLIADKQKAVSESVKRKKLLREHGIDLATGKRESDPDSDAGDSVSKADHEAAISKAQQRMNRLAIELPVALSDAGCTHMKRAIRHLDLDAVDFDDEVSSGLNEQIEELKTEFPEFFASKKPRTPVAPASAVGAGRKQADTNSGNWTDAFKKQLGQD